MCSQANCVDWEYSGLFRGEKPTVVAPPAAGGTHLAVDEIVGFLERETRLGIGVRRGGGYNLWFSPEIQGLRNG